MATNPSRPKFASFNDFIADGSKPKKAEEKNLVAVKVRATRTGYYDLILRQEGDEFVVRVNKASKGRDGMLPSWVEPVKPVKIPVAPIPETQETAHLRGGEPSSDESTSAANDSADSDAVI